MFELIILVLLVPIALVFAAYINAFEANIIFDFLDKIMKQKKNRKGQRG
jgi:hypothetical protein